jgi:hypothetical protein
VHLLPTPANSSRWLLAAAALAALCRATPLFAQDQAAGYVKTVMGTAFIVRAGEPRPAEPGQPILEGDALRTGGDGQLGVSMKDQTRVSLGPNTDLTIAQFMYAPADGRLGFVMRIVSGVLSYISGRIAKLAPESIRIETPSAIVGVRGTHLLIGVGVF